jgi:acyl carrier protein
MEEKIHQKIMELARGLGKDARGLKSDDILLETGLLDSAALLELIFWTETEFGVPIEPEELTVDNFGSMRLMAAYLAQKKESH